NVYAMDGLADCARGNKEYEKAKQLWEKAMAAGMNRAIAQTRIADACLQMEQFAQARHYYDQVLSVSEDKFALLGQLRLIETEPGDKQNKIIDAAKIFDRLLVLDPSDHRTLNEFNAFRIRYPEIDAYIQA
ncbi:tetratricopeptide repeat protein, partial [Desulfobacter sp. UBA2225]|uniref:tetratricopeptide repeat protein n=1 Tax=Desulfobacter sp. UBA2225 TaxID=1961413 RepID=UPI00257A4C16